jgi:hypothetical protein
MALSYYTSSNTTTQMIQPKQYLLATSIRLFQRFDYSSELNMANLHSSRQLIFADDNNDKESISVTILEVFKSKIS